MNHSILQLIWWRLLRLFRFNKLSWDKQYAAGRWHTGGTSSETLELAHKLSHGGNVIEFGCGEGNLPFLLSPESYNTYIGYDISEEAINTANNRVKDLYKNKINFEICDMENWCPLENPGR